MAAPGVRSRAVAGYAKRNLRDVQDMAVRFGFSKSQEAFDHRDRTAEEIYVVLSGSGRVKLDEELVELAALDAVRVSPGVTRSFQAGTAGLEALAARDRNRARSGPRPSSLVSSGRAEVGVGKREEAATRGRDRRVVPGDRGAARSLRRG